jgi:hypothetical protein
LWVVAAGLPLRRTNRSAPRHFSAVHASSREGSFAQMTEVT